MCRLTIVEANALGKTALIGGAGLYVVPPAFRKCVYVAVL
jgi:hypothetical protein